MLAHCQCALCSRVKCVLYHFMHSLWAAGRLLAALATLRLMSVSPISRHMPNWAGSLTQLLLSRVASLHVMPSAQMVSGHARDAPHRLFSRPVGCWQTAGSTSNAAPYLVVTNPLLHVPVPMVSSPWMVSQQSMLSIICWVTLTGWVTALMTSVCQQSVLLNKQLDIALAPSHC